MSFNFGKIAHAPGVKPDDITASYYGKTGTVHYSFDRPEKCVFELVRVMRRGDTFEPERSGENSPPENSYFIDPEYTVADGIPSLLKAQIREYADEKCADDVTGESVEFITSLRKQ